MLEPGDRVRVSRYGANTLKRRISKIGTVRMMRDPVPNIVKVQWDDIQYPDYVHSTFVEKVHNE